MTIIRTRRGEACLERYIGQLVFRFEPNYHFIYGQNCEIVCIKRGVVTGIRHNVKTEFGFYKMLVSVKWDDGSEGHGYFDYGLDSLKDLSVLVKGGLLEGTDGCFSEPQCEGLKAILPLYRQILEQEGYEY